MNERTTRPSVSRRSQGHVLVATYTVEFTGFPRHCGQTADRSTLDQLFNRRKSWVRVGRESGWRPGRGGGWGWGGGGVEMIIGGEGGDV